MHRSVGPSPVYASALSFFRNFASCNFVHDSGSGTWERRDRLESSETLRVPHTPAAAFRSKKVSGCGYGQMIMVIGGNYADAGQNSGRRLSEEFSCFAKKGGE